MQPHSDSSVTSEVREIRQELWLLRDMLSPRAAAPAGSRLRVHIERCEGERKPYLLSFKGITEKRVRMSATRAAITLAVLLDLDLRSQGLAGISRIRELAYAAVRVIAPDEKIQPSQEQIRVGLYRFAKFWHDELGELLPVAYDAQNERLAGGPQSGACFVDIITSDPRVEDALALLGRPPMLDRLRRDRFLFVPAGGSGGESFLNEVYSAPGQLNVALAYPRPQLATVPAHLVQKYAKTPYMAARHALMHKRFAEGTLSYTEIIPEDVLDRMTHADPAGRLSYFPGMPAAEIAEHLGFLENLVMSERGYNLILTRAELPFYVGTYRGLSCSIVCFFRRPNETNEASYSSFAVWGTDIVQMTQTSVFEWLLSHPSTTTDCSAVASYIRKCRRTLVSAAL